MRLPRQRWQISADGGDRTQRLAEQHHLPPLLAQVMLNRGIDTPQKAERYLDPELQQLPSVLEEFPDLAIALEYLGEAVVKQQPIAICGDYDADGMTSTALLLRALRSLGAQVSYAIPSRMQEGYGINQRIVDEFYAEGVRLILTVDNGIAAYEPIAHARNLGMVVIVTDHHDLPPQLPPAHAILNPKLIREESPFRGVAGVGVAYILAICLAQVFNQSAALTNPLLELFTLGTIADLAPLTGVNRRWVRRGLGLLPQSRLAGVQALIQVSGVSQEKGALKPEAIGFRLGPRINAVGRIGDPQVVIDLLTTDDLEVALERAQQCEEVNQLRRRMCELIEQEAIAHCEAQQYDLARDRVLVLVQKDWHHGVIGIVASRLVERYGVPVFIGTYEDEAQQQVRGSARGIPEFNVFEGLQCCADVLEKFGGHRAAGGFSLAAAHLGEMRSRLVIFANMHLQPQHLQPLVSVDAEAKLADLTLDLYQAFDQLHPCGIENPDPVFWTPNVRVLEQKTIGQNRDHLKVTMAQARDGADAMKAIAWRWGEYCPLPSPIDIAYRLRLNEWNGRQSVELELVGVRLPCRIPSETAPLVAASSEGDLLSSPAEDDLPSSDATSPQLTIPVIGPTPEPLPPSPVSPPLVDGIAFTFSRRRYQCSILPHDTSRELHIHNAEGGVLVIRPKHKVGQLVRATGEAQTVDLTHPFYADLMHAALNALQLAEKDDLLKKKDRLIAEQATHIAALQHQLDQNRERPSSAVPLPRLADDATAIHPGTASDPQAAAKQNATASESSTTDSPPPVPSATALENVAPISSPIAPTGTAPERVDPMAASSAEQPQTTASEISGIPDQGKAATDPAPTVERSPQPRSPQPRSLQPNGDRPASSSPIPAPPSPPPLEPAPVIPPVAHTSGDRDAAVQALKTQLGSSVWFCLDERSQKALVRSHLLHQDALSTGGLDFSAAGDRLCAIVQREVVQPFFNTLYTYLEQHQHSTHIGSLELDVKGRYPIGAVPPLIATQWETLQTQALSQSNQPADPVLYWVTTPTQFVSEGDRALIQQFLTTWEHPLADWFLEDLEASASLLDQVDKLHRIVMADDVPLNAWHFDLVRSLVIGTDIERGLLQELYGPRN